MLLRSFRALAHTTHRALLLKRAGFLESMAIMMSSHPSPVIASSQVAAWRAVFVDSAFLSMPPLLSPVVPTILRTYTRLAIRVSWDQFSEDLHPFSCVYREEFDDDEEYAAWFQECKSSSVNLLKCVAKAFPAACLQLLQEDLLSCFTKHGNEPRRDESVTRFSPAYAELEALSFTMEAAFSGTFQDAGQDATKIDPIALSSASNICSAILSFSPDRSSLLMIPKVSLVNNLRHYFKHDPSSLPTAVSFLLSCLSCPCPSFVGRNQWIERKSGIALVTLGKLCNSTLSQYLDDLTNMAKEILSQNDNIQPQQRVYLTEFLTCVANDINDPARKVEFVTSILSASMDHISSGENFRAMTSSVEGMLTTMGICPSPTVQRVTDPAFVRTTSMSFSETYSALNQIMNVGKRCDARPKIWLSHSMREDSISLKDLAANNSFAYHWPKVLPPILKCLDLLCKAWSPQVRGPLLLNDLQRYAFAITDEEAVFSIRPTGDSSNPMEAVERDGLVITGTSRRQENLAARWSYWLCELQQSCLGLLGLSLSQRAFFSPELRAVLPAVSTTFSEQNLKHLEHRQFIYVIKTFVEPLLTHTPVNLYHSYLTPILYPILNHAKWRIASSWKVNQDGRIGSVAPASAMSKEASADCVNGGGTDAWYESYYAYCGLFIGDLGETDGETLVEKVRNGLTQAWSDCLLTAFALKGDWALVLANVSKAKNGGSSGSSVER